MVSNTNEGPSSLISAPDDDAAARDIQTSDEDTQRAVFDNEVEEFLLGGDGKKESSSQGGSLTDVYGYDPGAAVKGVGIPWPKLGKDAVLGIASTSSQAYRDAMDKAVRQFGDRKTGLGSEARRKVHPVLCAKHLFLWMKGVSLKPPGSEDPDLFILKEVDNRGRVVQEVEYRFEVDDSGILVDTFENRKKMLHAFWPGLWYDVIEQADDNSNFKDAGPDAEEVEGNS